MAATAAGSSDQHERSCPHIPTFSARHPIIPRLYVMPWKQDMKNRKLLLENAALAHIPVDPLEESLHFCGRERLCHSQASSLTSSSSSSSSSSSPSSSSSSSSPTSSSSSSSSTPSSGSSLLAHHSSLFSRYNSSAVTTGRLYQT